MLKIERMRLLRTRFVALLLADLVGVLCRRARRNSLVERTHNGIAPRCAQVHDAHRGAIPLRSAHRER